MFGRTVLASLVTAGLMAALLGCSGSSGVKRQAGGVIVKAGPESVFDLRVGDCIVPPTKLPNPDKPELEKMQAVPCGDAHTHEVFARPAYTDSDVYPGPSKLRGFADGACLTEFEGYVGTPYEDSTLGFSYLLPSLRSWNEDKDRTVVCLLVATDAELTTTAKASGL